MNLGQTPTVSQFLDAANWEYQKTGRPDDLRPFKVDGEQLSFTDPEDGISAHVWRTADRQLIISFEGTQAISGTGLATNPAFTFRQVIVDTGIAQGEVTDAQQDAADFARYVTTIAARRGIGVEDVFLTGHSLGGIQAEYAAQQTGLGGIAFESTGLPRSADTPGNGRNFINVVQYGDPVANYASDIDAMQPFAPVFRAGGAGALPHYGYVAMIGNPDAQRILEQAAVFSELGPIGVGLSTAVYGAALATYHLPNVQAYNLGVELTQYGAIEVLGDRSGPILEAADYTIADLIEATGATLSAPRDPHPHISPTAGAFAGEAAMLLDSGSDFAEATHFDDVVTLVNALVLADGGVCAPEVERANTVLADIFLAAESDLAGALSRALDDLADGDLFDLLPHSDGFLPPDIPVAGFALA